MRAAYRAGVSPPVLLDTADGHAVVEFVRGATSLKHAALRGDTGRSVVFRVVRLLRKFHEKPAGPHLGDSTTFVEHPLCAWQCPPT